MKFKSILMLTAILGIASTSMAQFATGPRQVNAVSSLPFTMVAFAPAAGSNISTRVPFRISPSGNVGFYTASVNTNANTTTMKFLFEVSQDGSTWFTPQERSSFVVTSAGTTPVRLMTNMWSLGELKNFNWLRLSTITNGHASSTFFTNLTFFQH